MIEEKTESFVAWMSVLMELSVMFEVELLYKKQHNQIWFFLGVYWFIYLFI